MYFKSQKYYNLASDAYLSEIFREIPTGAFLNKGRCGNGGNHLELTNKQRDTIIPVPTKEIINSMIAEDESIQPFHYEITDKDLIAFFAKDELGKKIMCTPESFPRLMKIAGKIRRPDGTMADELTSKWFLLLDECHSYITEEFRDNMLAPFDFFFEFRYKSVMSATPYYFSDPRMQDLVYHNVKIIGTLGKVNLINCISVDGTLKAIINNAVLNKEKTFIFINSVTSINRLINACSLQDCHVYCSDDKDRKNRAKLCENWKFYKPKTIKGAFGLINFFTTKAFEGWNLKGETKANLYVVTDVSQKNTLVGLNKCVQALGRWRKPEEGIYELPKLYHVFNTREIRNFRSIDEISRIYKERGDLLLKQNSQQLEHSIKNGIPHKPHEMLKRYCDNYDTGNPKFNTYKFDQIVNEQANNEVFNQLSYIQSGWIQYGFEIQTLLSYDKWESQRDVVRKSNANSLKDDYHLLIQYSANSTCYCIGRDETQIIRDRNPLAFRAFKLLTLDQMNTVKYNVKKVTQLIINAENPAIKLKLMKLISLEFKVYASYSKNYVKDKLQTFYNTLGIVKPSGLAVVAKATDILAFFDADECKLKDNKGKWVHGFKLIRKHFEMQLAA